MISEVKNSEQIINTIFSINKYFVEQRVKERKSLFKKESCTCGNPESSRFIYKGEIQYMCMECFALFLEK